MGRGPVDHTLRETTTGVDGGGQVYYTISVRFQQSDSKANLLQKLTDKLKQKVAWYRVGYHQCEHDEESSSPCSWTDSVEWTAKDTTIPAGVPSF